MASRYQRYLLPGLVFQGMLIGGGYATGRELVEFFLPAGAAGGLVGMAVSSVVFSLVMAISFELCRMTGSYDYRHFLQRLLGRGWFLFEILLVLLMVVVLSVIAAASGEIVHNLLGLPPVAGTLLLLLAIGVLVVSGGDLIEKFMGAWSLVLYACYVTLVAWTLTRFGPEVAHTFRDTPNPGGSLLAGVRYAGYSLAIVPLMLFALTHIRDRRDAVTAGLLAGPIGMLPAVCLFVSLMAVHDGIAEAPIPSAVLLAKLDAGWFEVVFQVALLGTLVQTGLGLLHGVNERIARTLEDRGRRMPPRLRLAVALALLLTALLLASAFGLVSLIARGYGLLTFGFIAVFVVPVLTVGLARVVRGR